MSKTSDRGSYLLATCFGLGHAKPAPGTVATVAALLVHWGLERLPAPWHLLAVGVITGLAIWAAGEVCKSIAEHDPQIIVIDEVAGALLALWLVRGLGLWAALAAVVMFRVLDIAKPWPIGRLESCKPAGVGVVADDVAAGIIAGLVVHLVWRL
jgi:phosphatidylglycerophosphatase A